MENKTVNAHHHDPELDNILGEDLVGQGISTRDEKEILGDNSNIKTIADLSLLLAIYFTLTRIYKKMYI